MQETEDVRMHVVVVTGMSGSGKSVVMDVLEDLPYAPFVVYRFPFINSIQSKCYYINNQ